MHRFWNKALLVSIGLACALAGTAARADDDEALIRRGLELRREHQDLEALDQFQQAYSLRATPRARAQIALAEQSLGRWVAAEVDLRAALSGDDEWIAHNRGSLEEALAFVSTHLGWILVSGNAPGARVALGGVSIGTLPMKEPARVVVGTAPLRVEADGYVPIERPVRVDANANTVETVFLDRAPPLAPVPKHEASPEASPTVARSLDLPVYVPAPRRFPWAALGTATLGLAGVGVGTAFGIETLIDKSARDERCNDGRCDQRGLALDSDARQAATVSTIGFGVGAASLAVSAWLFAQWMAPAGNVTVVPSATSKAVGLFAGSVW